MKRNNTGRTVRPSVSRLGVCAVCILTAGTIAAAGFAEQARRDRGVRLRSAATVSNAVTTAAIRAESDTGATYATLDAVAWKKASIGEYELAEVTAAPEKKAEVKKEKLDDVKLAATAIVNLRKAPTKSSEVLAIIDQGEEVTAFEKTEDGWYGVKYGGKKGYVLAECFEEVSEEPEETGPAAEEAPAAVNYGVVSCTDAEFDMLCYVVQSEVGNCSEASKIAVANVVINRVNDPLFPGSIEGVLTAPGQFTAVWNYYSRSAAPSQNTIDCVRRALSGENYVGSAVYYYAPRYCDGSWFESLTFCAEIDGQRFFC